MGCCSSGPDPDKLIEQGCGDLLVGCNPACDITLAPASVTPHHATLRLFDKALYVRDNGAGGGILVNSTPVAEGMWLPVRPGDVLRIGPAGMEVLWLGEGPLSVRGEWLTWRNGTVESLARVIHEGNRYSDLPVLADALEEAGCDDPRILGCCRHPAGQPEARLLLYLILNGGGSPVVAHAREIPSPLSFRLEMTLLYRPLPELIGRELLISGLNNLEAEVAQELLHALPTSHGPDRYTALFGLSWCEAVLAKYNILDLTYRAPDELLTAGYYPSGAYLYRELGLIGTDEEGPGAEYDADECKRLLKAIAGESSLVFLRLFLEAVNRPAERPYQHGGRLTIPAGYLPRRFVVTDAGLSNYEHVWSERHFYM